MTFSSNIQGADPEAFLIEQGSFVWVARADHKFPGEKVAKWDGYRLHLHTMQKDMLFRGYDVTIMNPDLNLPRIAVGPLTPIGDKASTLYYGKPLSFCTFVDHGQNQIGRQIVELGLDPCEFTAEQLQREGYSTFWTGMVKWPFIICQNFIPANLHSV